jgi:hypothetical protein
VRGGPVAEQVLLRGRQRVGQPGIGQEQDRRAVENAADAEGIDALPGREDVLKAPKRTQRRRVAGAQGGRVGRSIVDGVPGNAAGHVAEDVERGDVVAVAQAL